MKKKIQTGMSVLIMLILLITVIPMSVMAEEQTIDSDNQAVTDVATIPNCTYRTHVQNIGWQDWKSNGTMSGTSGQGLRLEGIEIKLNNQGNDLNIEYSTHIQNIGWQEFKSNGVMSGTSGQSLRLEAIKIDLSGNDAKLYDIYYRVHAQNVGWLDWASNGAESGTAGYGYRLEGIEIKIIPKGNPAPGATANPFKENIEAPYSQILQEYRVVEASSFSSNILNSYPNVNHELLNNKGKLYYFVADISGDSTPELVIASYSSNYGYRIMDMYRLEAKTPERIFDIYSMGYRAIYTICENQIIRCYGSGGVNAHTDTFYKLDGNNANIFQTVTYENPYYVLNDAKNNNRRITKADADKIISSYKPRNDLQWIKL